MKKMKIILLAILISITAFMAGSKAMEIIRKQQGIFRFEDYNTAEEAQEALLKLHPIGSSVDNLKETLKQAGSQCGFQSLRGDFLNEIIKEDDFLICGHDERGFLSFIAYTEWRTVITVNFPSKDTIKKIKVILLDQLSLP